MNVSELLNIVNALVPIEYAFEDDYVGITIGSEQSEVNGIVVGHELETSLLKYCNDKIRWKKMPWFLTTSFAERSLKLLCC